MTSPEATTAWYCIRTAPKQETKVATLLRREGGMEVFAPKIRFRRNRAGDSIWWTEALFPGYVFARFDYFSAHRQIRAISGVATIVQFGAHPASVSEDVVAVLRASISDGDTLEISNGVTPASEIVVVKGPLRGLKLLVTRVLPARERVAVLLEILGAEREVELDTRSVIPANPRAAAAAGEMQRV